MSNLPDSAIGRQILRDVLRSLTGRRLGKRLRRKYYLAALANTGLYNNDASLDTLVGDMNQQHDAEFYDCHAFAARWGATRVSRNNETFYVDPENGSDVTGNGKCDYPFASLSFLVDSLPHRIDHHYRVYILGDLTELHIDIKANFGPNGSLAIIGRATPTTVYGPYQVTADNNYFGVDQIIVAGTPWTTISLLDLWVKFTDGDAQNFAIPVFYNKASTIYFQKGFSSLSDWAINDHFDLIRPSITLTTNGISVLAEGTVTRAQGDEQLGGKIGFYNLNIDVTGSDRHNSIDVSGPVNFSFCRILKENSTPPIIFRDAEINTLPIDDTGILPASQTGLVNLNEIEVGGDGGLCGMNVFDVENTTTNLEVECQNADIRSINGSGLLHIKGLCEGDILTYGFWEISDAVDSLNRIGTLSLAGLTCMIIRISQSNLRNVSLMNISAAGLNGLLLSDGPNTISLRNCDNPTAQVFLGYGAQIDALTAMNIDSVHAAVTGIADILWNTIAVPAGAAWPASKAFVTDAQGAFIAGL